MTMTAKFNPIAWAALGFAIATAAPADAQQGQGPVARACAADIGKYCDGIAHGGGKVRACLQANKDQVSAECQTALATHGGGMGGMNGNGAQK